MNCLNRKSLFAVAALALGSFATQAFAQTAAAETACMVAVNNNYGGKLDQLDVVSTDFSQAGTVVIIEANGERWRCLASNDGKVEELRVQE